MLPTSGILAVAGDDFHPSNYINIAAVLYMWVTMPAFGAAAYVPSITLGKACTRQGDHAAVPLNVTMPCQVQLSKPGAYRACAAGVCACNITQCVIHR